MTNISYVLVCSINPDTIKSYDKSQCQLMLGILTNSRFVVLARIRELEAIERKNAPNREQAAKKKSINARISEATRKTTVVEKMMADIKTKKHTIAEDAEYHGIGTGSVSRIRKGEAIGDKVKDKIFGAYVKRRKMEEEDDE